MNRYLASLVLLLLFSNSSYAQKNVVNQDLAWVRYSLKLNLSPEWVIRQEVENRFYVDPQRQHQFLVRSHLQNNLGKGWQTALGFTYFIQTLPQNPNATFEIDRVELRPQLELQHKNNLTPRFSLVNRYWAEFRFFEQNPGDGDFEFGNARMRYKLEGVLKLNDTFTLKVHDEILINFGKNIVLNHFDQNRISASLSAGTFAGFGLELAYINWYQQRSTGTDFFNRNIARLTITHSLNLKRKSILD